MRQFFAVKVHRGKLFHGWYGLWYMVTIFMKGKGQLLYSLLSSFGSYSQDFTSLTLPTSERTPSNLQWRISMCCTFCAPIDPLSVQSGSNRGFIPCLRILLYSLTWARIKPMTSDMEVHFPFPPYPPGHNISSYAHNGWVFGYQFQKGREIHHHTFHIMYGALHRH